jgi:repressor LexA
VITSVDTVNLTDAQSRVLQAAADHITVHGYAPTLREIGAAAGLASTSTVAYHLDRLAELGWLRRDPGLPRALVLLGRVPETVSAGGFRPV